MSYFTAFVLLLLLAGVWALLERNHHRTTDLPHAPYGADAAGDSDLWRVCHDLLASRR
ncbi:MAG: hypothetical protein ABWX73_10775 [Marmoricola sp.]